MGIIAIRDTYEKDGWQKHPSGADVRVENGSVKEVYICTTEKFEGLLNIVKSNPPDEINDSIDNEDEYIQIRLNRIECKLDDLVEKINQIHDASKNVSGNG